MSSRCRCYSRCRFRARTYATLMLYGSLLRYLGPTADQIWYAYGACRVHLVLPKARVKLILSLVLLLVVIDLLLASLDATQVALGRGRLTMRPAMLSWAGCFMPHEACLRELIAIGDNIARDTLCLIQTVLGDQRYSTFRLLAHLNVSLAAPMHSSSCSVDLTIAVLVAWHTYYLIIWQMNAVRIFR